MSVDPANTLKLNELQELLDQYSSYDANTIQFQPMTLDQLSVYRVRLSYRTTLDQVGTAEFQFSTTALRRGFEGRILQDNYLIYRWEMTYLRAFYR